MGPRPQSKDKAPEDLRGPEGRLEFLDPRDLAARMDSEGIRVILEKRAYRENRDLRGLPEIPLGIEQDPENFHTVSAMMYKQ